MAFVKVAREDRELTGAEKAAVLFVSLGQDAWTDVAQYLHTEEIEKLRATLKDLRYGHKEEVRVLLELAEYGKKKGIWKEVPDDKTDKVSDIRNAAVEDPEEVAKVIATWIGNGDE